MKKKRKIQIHSNGIKNVARYLVFLHTGYFLYKAKFRMNIEK